MVKQFKTEKRFRFRRWAKTPWAAFASLHRQVSIGVLSVGMSIIALSTQVVAAQNYQTAEIYSELDSTVVATEKASPTRSVMVQTMLFNNTSSEAVPGKSIESMLKSSPSVDVRERGGKGVQADYSIRGGSFDQTQVMLNGINFTDARTGHQTHALPIDIDIVSGMELLDGVVGVGAYAGAININTAPAAKNALRIHFTPGMYGYMYGNISGAVDLDKAELFAAISVKHSDGYMTNTDFTNYNGYARGKIYIGNAGMLDIQAGGQRRNFGANGFYSLKYPNQYEATATALASVRWLAHFSGGWMTTAYISWRGNRDRFELIKGDESKVPFNHHITNDIGAEVTLGKNWLIGNSTIGADITHNQIRSTVLGEQLENPQQGRDGVVYGKGKARTTGNIWLRHKYQSDVWGIGASAAISLHAYGKSFIGSAEASYNPISSMKIFAGVAKSMRLPTFTDLYYTAADHVSNTSLTPENAITYRLGTQWAMKEWSASLLGYMRRGRDIIDWIKLPDEDLWRSMQITRMNTYGVELTAGYNSESGTIKAANIGYSYIHSDKTNGVGVSRYAMDHLRHKLSGHLAVRFLKNFTASATATLFDRAWEHAAHCQLDAKISWQYRAAELYVEGTNITNT
ncbi:MAG: TonB-dependent receptor, partial [Bacteroidales bacterium]|nr:TonB-dependent receptor [Bacteroidales bacterium]